MTERQRDYILGLDEELIDFSRYENPRYLSKNILGEDWVFHYKDISHEEASNCIIKLNNEVKRCGCREAWWNFDIDYNGDAIF